MCFVSMFFLGGWVGSQLDKWIFPSQCFWQKMVGMYLAEWFFYWYRPMFYLFLLALRNVPQKLVSFKKMETQFWDSIPVLGWWPFFSNQRLAAKRMQKWWKKILLRWVYTIARFMIYEVIPAWCHIQKNGSIKIGPKLPEKVQRNLNPVSPFFLEEKS